MKYISIIMLPLLVVALCAIDTTLRDYTVDIRWLYLRVVVVVGIILGAVK